MGLQWISSSLLIELGSDGSGTGITKASAASIISQLLEDNGIGLPEDRARLFEPYVTTRSEGTGLGLPIVKKIIEEHGGSLTLETAPAFDGQDHHGAMAVISLPLAIDATTDQGDKADE